MQFSSVGVIVSLRQMVHSNGVIVIIIAINSISPRYQQYIMIYYNFIIIIVFFFIHFKKEYDLFKIYFLKGKLYLYVLRIKILIVFY